jgi:hypothetical protein
VAKNAFQRKKLLEARLDEMSKKKLYLTKAMFSVQDSSTNQNLAGMMKDVNEVQKKFAV